MLITLVVLQSFSLMFLMASYSVLNKMLGMKMQEIQQLMALAKKRQPWPDREN